MSTAGELEFDNNSKYHRCVKVLGGPVALNYVGAILVLSNNQRFKLSRAPKGMRTFIGYITKTLSASMLLTSTKSELGCPHGM